jgi:hypothetical protein
MRSPRSTQRHPLDPGSTMPPKRASRAPKPPSKASSPRVSTRGPHREHIRKSRAWSTPPVVQRRGLGRCPCGLQAAQIWRLRGGRARLTTDRSPCALLPAEGVPSRPGPASHRPTLGSRGGRSTRWDASGRHSRPAVASIARWSRRWSGVRCSEAPKLAAARGARPLAMFTAWPSIPHSLAW